MTEAEELKALARIADSKGDKATALAALRKLESLSQRQPQQPSKEPSYLEALTGDVQTPIDHPDTGGAGLARGVKDWYERFTQATTGAGPGDVYGPAYGRGFTERLRETLTPPGAFRFPQQTTAEQAAAFLKDKLGRPLSEQERARVAQEPQTAYDMQLLRMNRAASAQRRQFSENATLGDQAGRLAMNVAPWLAVRTPQSIAGMTGFGGATARVGFGAGLGAGIGATEFVQPGQTRAGNAGLGATIGGLASGATEGVRALMPARTVARKVGLHELLDETTAPPQAKRGEAIAQQNKIDLSLSQRTGSPELANLEREGAAAKPSLARADAKVRISQFSKRLNSILDKVDPRKTPRAQAVDEATKAYRAEVNVYRAERSKVFQGALDDAALVTRNQPIIDSAPIVTRIQDEIKNLRSAVQSENTREAIATLERELAKFKVGNVQSSIALPLGARTQMAKQAPNLTVKNAQQLLADYSEGMSGSGRLFKDISDAADRRVSRILFNAVDDAVAKTAENPAIGQGAQILRQARQDYRFLSDYLDELGETTLGKLLNTTTPANSKQVLTAIKGMPEDEARRVFPIIAKHNPEAMQALNRDYFRTIISKSRVGDKKPVGGAALDPQKLAANWKTDGEFFARFPDREVRRELIQARQALRRIAPPTDAKVARGVTEEAAEEAGLLGSLHPVFLFRAAMRRYTPDKLADLLLTPKGRQALIKASNPAFYNAAEVSAAVMYLNRVGAEPSEEESDRQ